MDNLTDYITGCETERLIDDTIFDSFFEKYAIYINLKDALGKLSSDEKNVIDTLTFKAGIEALDNYKDYFNLNSKISDDEKLAIVQYYLHKHFGLN